MLALPIHSRQFGSATAILDKDGRYSYEQLYQDASITAANISAYQLPAGHPVLFLLPSGYHYVVIQWGIWLAGHIAVPVHTAHPAEEISYLLQDTGASLFIYDAQFEEKAGEAVDGKNSQLLPVEQIMQDNGYTSPLPDIDPAGNALLIYTSGTTGKPKGVTITHQQLNAQMRSLSQAWGWQPSDHILNVLPMHHVHGIINITCCALYNGACCEMYPSFDAAQVADIMTSGRLTLFMAVPTIYHKLIQYFELLPPGQQVNWQLGMQKIRLMVSGSAALPVTVLEKWRQLSGHTLLERYGMTEIGMALSNPLHGTRMPGYVGMPLPGVSVKLTDEEGKIITDPETPGQVYVKGATVFSEYWNRPEETLKSFDNGWFKTGDIAAFDQKGNYRILGRNSSDIIKSGGYKISALEIENLLLEHPSVKECAIVALPDEEWGECIAAAIAGGDADIEAIKTFARQKLAPYKLPRRWVMVSSLPRNSMGKTIKNEVKKLF